MATATSGAALAAGTPTATDKIPVKVNLWVNGNHSENSLDMAAGETLSGLIRRVIEATKTEYHVEISWDGRDQSTLSLSNTPARETSNPRENQYFFNWTDLDGWTGVVEPQIELHTGAPTIAHVKTPLRVRELVSCPPLHQIRGAFKTTKEVFDRVKVADVCDLKHHNVFTVRVFDTATCGKTPRRPSVVAASTPSPRAAYAQSTLSGKRTEVKS